mgnify:CR=1 FL=1
MLRGTLMKITKTSGEFVWLAILDEDTKRFWVYDFDTKAFHMNKWLTLDYEIDRVLEYVGIDRAQAIDIVTTRDRKIDKRTRMEHQADDVSVPLAEVLGDAGVPSARSLTRIKAEGIANSRPGTWVTWKIYSPNQEQTARVAASDIRTGKVKTITKLAGPVETRTVKHDDGEIEVQVRRIARAS